jgi:branched-chain amino acid aminotransferase
VISPVGRLGDENGVEVINNNEAGPVARHLYAALTDLQYGRSPDPYGWTTVVEPWK